MFIKKYVIDLQYFIIKRFIFPYVQIPLILSCVDVIN